MKNASAFLVLVTVLTAIAAFVGWVANIVKLFGLFGGGLSAELALRLAGVPLAIIGAIAGYL